MGPGDRRERFGTPIKQVAGQAGAAERVLQGRNEGVWRGGHTPSDSTMVKRMFVYGTALAERFFISASISSNSRGAFALTRSRPLSVMM